MGSALSKWGEGEEEDAGLDQFYGLGLRSREPSLGGTHSFGALPEELVLFILAFCDLPAVVAAGTVSRRLRKIASDETLWRSLYKARWGACPLRESRNHCVRGEDRFEWREEFMRRQHYLYVKRRAQLAAEEVAEAPLWERFISNLNPFAPIRKRKVVFVGLEAAGKTTCCFRLQTTGPDPNYFPIPRQCFPPIDVFQTRELEFVAMDVGGYKSKYYDSYSNRVFAPRLQECEAIVFVIDSTDDEQRLMEAKRELSAVLDAKMETMFERSLNLFERDNRAFPVLLLANKQDLPNARKADQIASMFESCFEPHESVVWACRATIAAKREAECLTEAMWWLLYEMEHGH